TNDSERRAKLMRYAGGKFHLQLSERVRALARNHDDDETHAEDEEYSEADCEVAQPYMFDRALQRSSPMFDHKLPRLADDRHLKRTARSRSAASPTKSTWSWRA